MITPSAASSGIYRRRPVARLVQPTSCRFAYPRAVTEEHRSGQRQKRLRVGLLGGSFNPAHEGHLAISLEAYKRLDLDQIWWLVSPQNPLKSRQDMADLPARIASARNIVAGHPRIIVTDLERAFGTVYTVDTVKRLKRNEKCNFVWLIGSDNLLQLPKWRNWRELLNLVPIAVFDREPYSYRALAGQVAHAYAPCRLEPRFAADLVGTKPPAWVYFRLRRHRISSTMIRRRLGRPAEEGAGSTSMGSGSTEGTSS
ncbi:MAG: nicotinate (nicotinamide) nucleotide adenylyltransferase [Pseudomonadota bacterium]